MSAERDGNVDVLIQGAGIGGLTLAIAMIRKGYTVRIVERASGLSEVGAGIWMAANPMQVFDRLGFAEKIMAAGWAVHRITLQDYQRRHPSGERSISGRKTLWIRNGRSSSCRRCRECSLNNCLRTLSPLERK